MNQDLAPKVNIARVGISNTSTEDVIRIFNEVIEAGKKIRVCVTPANCIVWGHKNERLRNIYNEADLTLCDGVPVLWASKFLGTPVKERITGLDLLPKYIEECYIKEHSFFLLGAKPGVGEALAKKMTGKYPGIKIVGMYSPPFADAFSDAENAKMIQVINAAKPDVLWVSLTAPKQDYWIAEHLHELNVHIAIGVGGAFEVTAGLIKRAPGFMQKMGLEWLFRFLKEPKRLFRRYVVEAPAFLPLVFRQKFSRKPSP